MFNVSSLSYLALTLLKVQAYIFICLYIVESYCFALNKTNLNRFVEGCCCYNVGQLFVQCLKRKLNLKLFL